MDALQFLNSRRSVRHFKPGRIPRPVIERLLKTACQAPSAHNRQPWRFLVLEEMQAKAQLVEAMQSGFKRDLEEDGLEPQEIEQRLSRSRDRIMSASAAVVLCMDPLVMDAYPDETRQTAERLMAVQSTALAGGTLLLAAHAEELGAVWICAPLFAQRAVREAFELPDSWEPQALVLIGYPAQLPEPRLRRPLDEVVRYR
jgi:coenzyme F420-0:L-glutamate ligase/coenzyme F420-1:gamma-L-glutamate ligase